MNEKELKSKYGNCICKLDQIPDEFDWLMNRFQKLDPSNICEIGSWHGGTLFYWLSHSRPGSKVVSVDINHAHVELTVDRWKMNSTPDVSKLHLITGDSASKETARKVKKILPTIDFLFVDGDHTREGLIADLETYGPMVRKGGIISIHDTDPRVIEVQERGGHGVSRVWQELKEYTKGHRYEEIFLRKETARLSSYGIGVIHVGKTFHPKLNLGR